MQEEWRPVRVRGVDFTGYYEVSNLGRIKKLPTTSLDGRCHLKERIMKPTLDKKGYLTVNLLKDGKRYTRVFVHRIVAEAFIPNPENLPIVNHKDFDILNCRVDNLEWTTMQGNYDYSAKRGRYVRTAVWNEHITKTLRSTMGKPIIGTQMDGGAEITLSSLNQCREYGFQPSCVSNCCKGKRRQTGGYTWRYADEKNLKQTR